MSSASDPDRTVRLRRPRQFIASTGVLNRPQGWNTETLRPSGLTIHSHPDVPLTTASHDTTELALIGYAFDPHDQHQKNVLETLADLDVDGIAARLAEWAGRFVLFLDHGGRLFVFNDPCGLRSVFYLQDDGALHLSSQPTALPGHDDLPLSPVGQAYWAGSYADSHEPWLPAGAYLRQGVGHLVPNHYLDADAGRQVRFWPRSPVQQRTLEQAVDQSITEFVTVIEAAAQNFSLALPVTAGWDSRTILAASADLPDVYHYTLLYRDMTPAHPDVETAGHLLSELGFEHHVLDCRGQAPDDFLQASIENTLFGNRDSADITFGLTKTWPSGRVAMKGNCSEIARHYYPEFRGRVTGDKLAYLAHGWEKMPAFVDVMDQWAQDTERETAGLGYRILDLFYWEHRMATWQAQSQSEWDIAQETFTPYNYRPLILAMLSAPLSSRRGSEETLYRRIIGTLRPELMRWPVNPQHGSGGVKTTVKDTLNRLGLLGELGYRRDRWRRRRRA